MLGEVFYWLFNMSIAAAVSGTVILLLRCIKQIPRRFIAALWAIPFLRMWLPVGLGSRYSLMSLISRVTTKTVVVYEWYDGASFTYSNFMMAANSYFPITYKVNLLEQVFNTSSVVWFVIAAALWVLLALLYTAATRELRNAKQLQDNLYLSDKITTPAVYGILRPKIILPDSYQNKDLTFVLLHETVHLRRRDNLWRLLAFLTAALHWFNPLAWVFLKCFLADLEFSCDEKVLRTCGAEQKKAYALSLVDCAENHSILISAFGGARIRVRIENILSYRKLSLFSAVCFAVLMLAIAFVLLANAI